MFVDDDDTNNKLNELKNKKFNNYLEINKNEIENNKEIKYYNHLMTKIIKISIHKATKIVIYNAMM